MGERRGGLWTCRAAAALAAMLGIAALGPALANAEDGDTPSVALTLAPRADATVSQGAPFAFELTVTNPEADPVDLELVFGLAGPGGGEPVDFRLSDHVAEPGETKLHGRVTPSQWFAETGQFELLARSSDGAAAGLGFAVGEAEVAVPRFEDVTEQAGVGFTHHIGSLCNGTHTAGAAWGDIEGDGDLDLYVPDQDGPARLFVNEDGAFTDEASSAGVGDPSAEAFGAVFADYDNDGDPDLFVTANGPDRLFENDGTGKFTDVAPELGLADPRPATSGSFADFDGDGLLDLYVARWGNCTHDLYLQDTLYRQLPGGGFEDVTGILGDNTAVAGRGFLAGWLDYDLDGDQDLYLANDFTQGPTPQPNALWRNDGPSLVPGEAGSSSFANVSESSGTELAMNSMGLAIGDYDRDLDPDVAVSNMGSKVLLQNAGDGSFDERAEALGIDRPVQRVVNGPTGPEPLHAVTWGLDFQDLNNDGFEDLYVAAGAMDTAQTQPNELFAGTRDRRFLDLSAPSGSDDPGPSRGVAFGDYDDDGRVDMYVVNRGGSPRLYRNVTPRNGAHWLEVDTVGTAANADGCGARLRLTAGGRTQSRWVHCGSTSLGSGSDPTVHFGLGAAEVIERLRIEWPSGEVQQLTDLAADRRIVVAEPDPQDETPPEEEPPPPPDPEDPPSDPTPPSDPDDSPTDPKQPPMNGVGGFRSQARWTKLALGQIAARSLNPPRASRLLAHLSASIAEGLRRARRDERGARRRLPRAALLAGAAGPVLAELLPRRSARRIDATVQRAVRGANRKRRARRALEIGETAAAIYVRRSQLDRGDGTPDPPAADGPGDWVPTPPGMGPALEPGAARWKAWNVGKVSAVLPPAPPALGTRRFERALNEVYETSQSLTRRQRGIAEYWADGPGTITPPGHWNLIALRLLRKADGSERFTARVLEALNTAQADAFIACWRAKYKYFLVRPITEIRGRFDPEWETVVPTPPFPAYPSGHSTTSAAAAKVLRVYFRDRSRRLRRDAREAGISRILGGIHYRFDHREGRRLGVKVANRALAKHRPGKRGKRRRDAGTLPR